LINYKASAGLLGADEVLIRVMTTTWPFKRLFFGRGGAVLKSSVTAPLSPLGRKDEGEEEKRRKEEEEEKEEEKRACFPNSVLYKRFRERQTRGDCGSDVARPHVTLKPLFTA